MLNFIKHIEKQGHTQLSYMAYTYEKQIFETKSDLQTGLTKTQYS